MLNHRRKKPALGVAVCAFIVATTLFTPVVRAGDASSPPKPEENAPTETGKAANTKTEVSAGKPKAEAAWKTDIVAFDKYLGELTAKGRVPDEQALAKRVTVRPGGGELETEVMPVTDGAGGYVDLKPAKDTVQFRVNEALKGQTVTWEFELGHDARESYGGVIRLIPKSLKPQSVAEDQAQGTSKDKEKVIPFLNSLLVKVPPGKAGGSDFKAGDHVKLEGTIGDASGNKGINVLLSPSGPVAVYHLDAAPHTVFWVGLTKATITGPDRRTVPRRKPAADIVKVAKALIRASYFQYDEETLKEIYASKVQLLPGNRLFQYGLEVPRAAAKLGVVIDRDEMLPAVAKQAGRDPVPRQFVDQFVNTFRIEQLEVAEGEFVTEPNQPSESHDGKLRFSIRKGDVLLKVSVPGAFRFVQLRKTDGKWKVVAEY